MTDTEGTDGSGPRDGGLEASLLPYEIWTEEAFRTVAVRALAHVVERGLPGDHHFYVTFRTDHPGVVIPARLRARYPDEMTVVLQHKFWDLRVDEATRTMSVELSFGGVGAKLTVPFDAMTGFADPSVRWGLRFRAVLPDGTDASQGQAAAAETGPDGEAPEAASADAGADAPQVVSLDAFRRRRD